MKKKFYKPSKGGKIVFLPPNKPSLFHYKIINKKELYKKVHLLDLILPLLQKHKMN